MTKINNLSSEFIVNTAIDYYPLTVSLETPFREIISLMSQQKNYCQLLVTDKKDLVAHAATASCVVVLENKQIRGLITERDIVRFLAYNMKMDRYMAQQVMNQKVVTLKNTEIQDIFSILHLLKRHQIHHLPVVNEQNQLVGLITSENICNVLQPLDLLKWRQVKELMTTNIIHVSQDTSLLKLAQLMAQFPLCYALMVEQHSPQKLIPLGIVTQRDLLQYQLIDLSFESITAETVMSTPLFSISSDTSVWSAYQLMEEKRIRKLVVVDSDNFLEGILTESDVGKAIEPVEMYSMIETLQQKVTQLENENFTLLQERNFNLNKTGKFDPLQLGEKEQRDSFNKIIDLIDSLVVVLDPQGKIVSFNKTCEQITLYSYEEVKEQFLGDLFIDNSEKEEFLLLFNRLRDPSVSLPSSPYQNYWLSKTGDRHLISWSHRLLSDADGELRYIIITGNDLTLQQEKQLELQKLNQDLQERVTKRTKQLGKLIKQLETNKILVQKISEINPNIIYIYDFLNKSNTYVNKKIISLLGYKAEEIDFMGKDLFKQIMHKEDLRKMEDYYNQFATAKNGEIREIEYRIKDAQGKWHWLLSRDIIFSRTKEGKPKEILGTATDITKTKQIQGKSPWLNQDLFTKVKELKQKNKEITLLNEIHDFLQASLTVEEACNILSDLLQPLFPNMNGAIFMGNSFKNSFEMITHWGNKINTESFFLTNQCWALRRGRLHQSKNNQLGLSCDHILGKSEFEESFCIPLIAQGEALGLFYLSSLKGQIFTDLQKKLASTVGEQIALALSNLQLQEQLQQQNIRDALTNLFNRRYLSKILDAEIKIAAKNKQSLAVLMIDIDYFKRFNDTYGHDAGDKVLQELAVFLQNNIKQSDIACRYGGEELTLILKDISPQNAYKKAEMLRQKVKRLGIKYNNKFLGEISISIGLACYPTHGNTKELLLKLADEALYEAKNQGRDQVVISRK